MFDFTKTYLLAIALLTCAIGYSQEVNDTAVPIIQDIRFSTQTANVSTRAVTVSMFIDVTDDLSGAKLVLPDIIYPNGKRESCVATLVSGSRMEGTWQYDFFLPQYLQSGTAVVDVYLTDEALNHVFLTSSELVLEGLDADFDIANGNPDGVAPNINNITISEQTVDISTGDGLITIAVDVTDNLSGTGVVIPNLILPNGMALNGNAQLVSGNAMNGRWEKTFIIPQHTTVGTARFGLFMEDVVYNCISFDADGIASGGFDNDFEIVGGTADVTAPNITSFSVSTDAVFVEDGSALVSVLIGTTDDLSGVYQVIPHLTTPNGVISSNGATLISGDENDGLWRYTFTVPQYTSDGVGIFDLTVKDVVNNCAVLSFDDLDAMGFVASFLINPRSNSEPLHLAVARFDAYHASNKNVLRWSLSTFVEEVQFWVEHSTDGIDFEPIGLVSAVASAETSLFSFEHLHPKTGVHYYRLRQLDTTGKSSYSTIIQLSVQTVAYDVYPNPTTDWLYTTAAAEWATIWDVNGNLVARHQLVTGRIDLRELVSGTYWISFGGGRAAMKQMIVKQ
ncbi:MAG: T9SS type A sorting domain-containing protein [Bacteroidota bacterium]